MEKLSRDDFARGRAFIAEQGRALDWALYRRRFEGGSETAVIDALRHYLNDDGGFGHALEPDVRTPSSSALATGIALGLLAELDCSAEHPMVQGALSYLMETFDAEEAVWRVVPEDANDYPHAPWWHDDGGSLAETFDDYVVVPRAELLAHLYTFSLAAGVPKEWLDEVAERAVADIEALECLGEGGGDYLRYSIELAESEGLPSGLRKRLVARIRDVAPGAVSRDPNEWDSYVITPLKLAPTPDSLLAGALWEDVQRNLDYSVASQTPQGNWEPTWTWDESYPEAWLKAAQEWRSELTLRTLTVLKAYNRIETA